MNTAVNKKFPATQQVRKLGAIETRMALFHGNLNGSTQGTQAIFFNAQVSCAEFLQATKSLYDNYVALQCAIKKHDDGLWFHRHVAFEDVAVRYSQVENTADIEALIGQSINSAIDAEKALWSIQLIRMGDTGQQLLLFSAHHSIIDANGMHDLANSFFTILAAVLSGRSLPELPLVELPLAVDELLQPAAAFANNPTLPARPHDLVCPIDYRRTGWQFVTLQPDQVVQLNSALQHDKLKLHSLLSAALCQALHAQGVIDDQFNFGTAVSLRFLQDSNPEYSNPLGCYMSIAANQFTIDEDLVAFARKYDRELMQKIFTGCLNKVETHYADFSAATQKIASLDNFSQGAGITNMGHVAIAEEYPGITITGYRMLANRVSANFSVVAHCYDFGGQQYIGLVYPQPCLADEVVAKVAADLQRRLQNYCTR
jgi:hypothetical protein